MHLPDKKAIPCIFALAVGLTILSPSNAQVGGSDLPSVEDTSSKKKSNLTRSTTKLPRPGAAPGR